MNTIRLAVQDMSCGGCVSSVQHAIQTVPGVISVRADLASKAVEVDAAATVTPSEVVAAVERAGYEAELAG